MTCHRYISNDFFPHSSKKRTWKVFLAIIGKKPKMQSVAHIGNIKKLRYLSIGIPRILSTSNMAVKQIDMTLPPPQNMIDSQIFTQTAQN